jgi:hypothetical protein
VPPIAAGATPRKPEEKSMTDANTHLPFDIAVLTRLAQLTQPHSSALLADVRAEFGDEGAPTLFVTALATLLGVMLLSIPNAAERAPDAFAQVWSVMKVPFVLEGRAVH